MLFKSVLHEVSARAYVIEMSKDRSMVNVSMLVSLNGAVFVKLLCRTNKGLMATVDLSIAYKFQSITRRDGRRH